jgi:purine-nucleoside phosphorylase
MDHMQQAVTYIQSKLQTAPELGLILGSGLGMVADLVENPIVIPYKDIPHFPVSTVEGHAGELVIGQLEGKTVIVMKGRFHLYEGYGVQQVAFPVRVMRKLGVRQLIVTNASGGVNTDFRPGDLMLISDHLNFQFTNPLIGPNTDEFGVRFPDMSEAYSKRMRAIARQVAAEQKVALQEGVYLGLLGPSYETPAEIRMIRTLGGDAVGMSTVAETITARHAGIEVLGISCISNMAAGILDQPLSHQEVIDTTERVKETFLKLILGIVPQL